MQTHSILASTLSRLTVIGTVFLGLLSGFGAIDTAWDFFPVFSRTSRPHPTDEEVRTAESGLQRVREDLTQRRKDLRALEASKQPDAQSNWFSKTVLSWSGDSESSALAKEISGLEALEYEMSRSLEALKQRQAHAKFSKTLAGRVFNWGGRLFSLYCVYRIVTSLVNLIIPRSPPATPGESAPTNADVISFVLAYLLSHLPFVQVPADKIAVISRQISLGFVGIIILSSIRRVLRGVARLLRVTSRSLGASLMLLTLAQVMGIYLMATLIQLRTSFPPPPARPDVDADEGIVNLFSTLPEYQFFGPLFDGSFLLAAAATGAVRPQRPAALPLLAYLGKYTWASAWVWTRTSPRWPFVLLTSHQNTCVRPSMQEVQVDSSEKLTTSDSPVESPSLPSVLYVDEALGKSVISPDEDALDGGRGWIVVLGCFIFSAATWGWALGPHSIGQPLKYGLDARRYRNREARGSLRLQGTGCDAIEHSMLKLTHHIRPNKPLLAAGALLWIASMLASAFCTTIWQFFITMGLMQGIADALVFPAIVALPAQWFKRYQGLATGIVVAGSSVGGAIASLIYRELLSAVGLRKSLAIFTAIHVVLLSAAYLMIAERASPGDDERRQAGIVWFDAEFFRDPVFWSVAGPGADADVNALRIPSSRYGTSPPRACSGYLGPVFLIPTFTAEKVPNLRELLAALPLVVLNLSAALGRTLVGFAADFFGPVNSLLVAITLSGLTQLVVWMFVSTYGGIMAFAILYGFFCGCFISLVSAVVVRIYGADKVAGLSGLLLLFNTPGYAAGAPIAGAILGATGNNWRVVAGYGGSVQIAGALCLVYARMKREPRIFAVY
ncbi:hypothetical protein ONZ51_g9199 [Trametes cubensis]|uniref:Major facilitator superfamily (MFS) profile domain-containing protein n=1 Tax=Trametes cubensis TaxID=1111947 RepID=A0AAD7X7I5_9APHY|nr:hypothetical protein ONZ51_g9199 [Trametes cubensis]